MWLFLNYNTPKSHETWQYQDGFKSLNFEFFCDIPSRQPTAYTCMLLEQYHNIILVLPFPKWGLSFIGNIKIFVQISILWNKTKIV